MKQIWLFLSIVLLMPALAQPQKKCDEVKNFRPLKTQRESDNAKMILKPASAIFGLERIYLLKNYYPALPSVYQKTHYSQFSLWDKQKPEDFEWVFLHIWVLKGYIGYRYLWQYPYPRSLRFRLGGHINIKWNQLSLP